MCDLRWGEGNENRRQSADDRLSEATKGPDVVVRERKVARRGAQERAARSGPQKALYEPGHGPPFSRKALFEAGPPAHARQRPIASSSSIRRQTTHAQMIGSRRRSSSSPGAPGATPSSSSAGQPAGIPLPCEALSSGFPVRGRASLERGEVETRSLTANPLPGRGAPRAPSRRASPPCCAARPRRRPR